MQDQVTVSFERGIFADIQFAEQLIKAVRTVQVVIVRQNGKELTLAEFTWTDKELIMAGCVFQLFDIPRFVHIDVIFGHDGLKIGNAVGQTFVLLDFHDGNCFCSMPQNYMK